MLKTNEGRLAYSPRAEGLPYKKKENSFRAEVPLRVLSLKRSTVGAFVASSRVLSRKAMTGDDVLERFSIECRK